MSYNLRHFLWCGIISHRNSCSILQWCCVSMKAGRKVRAVLRLSNNNTHIIPPIGRHSSSCSRFVYYCRSIVHHCVRRELPAEPRLERHRHCLCWHGNAISLVSRFMRPAYDLVCVATVVLCFSAILWQYTAFIHYLPHSTLSVNSV